MKKKPVAQRARKSLAGIAGATVISFAALFGAAVYAATPANQDLASASVRINIGDQGTCSATHLGEGRYLTAAHCTGIAKIEIETETGLKAPAETLWASKPYDLAMLYSDALDSVRRAAIDCRGVQAGDTVFADGNPFGMRFIRSKGTVLSLDTWPGAQNFWRDNILTDITIAPGNSGGGLFRADGRLVGVVVGAFVGYHYAFIVPSTTVCRLLGR